MKKRYEVRYSPLFYKDIRQILFYIKNNLANDMAAERLLKCVKEAIIVRSASPLSFEPYKSSAKRCQSYYRIYVRNYIIFYVVHGNIMEIRRMLYNRRDINNVF